MFAEREEFWDAIIAKVSRGSESVCLEVVKGIEGLDYFDIPTILSTVRRKWKKRAVFDKVWPSFLEAVGRRFYSSLSGGGKEYLGLR